LSRTLKGKSFTWQLSDTPIGSGDAGEVYAAHCLENPDLQGVAKAPARIATGGTIQRQAGQIAQESLALARLDGLQQGKAHPPRLLDEAHEFTRGTANYFIISETAPGKDLASMLAETRLAGKTFPQRVIITVLDALFDMFARAHRAGILWNDVKLDHIYWHNPNCGVYVIDWGNAVFLEEQSDSTRRTLPRWEDYRQLVETLGSFLQGSAPALYTDLGWDEFQKQDLDSPIISVLARRIAYQQQVVSLKEMENQSLIQVLLRDDPTLEGLKTIMEHQQILDQIGAAWPREEILEYSQALIKSALTQNEIQTAVKSTALVWDQLDGNLDFSWYLLREIFRQPDILAHPSLTALVKHALNENWPSALWALVSIARDEKEVSWWSQLVPVLRQKATGLTSPPPYQVCLSIYQWREHHNNKNAAFLTPFSKLLQNWRIKGTAISESPFDYEVLDLLKENVALPNTLRSDLKKSFAAGEKTIQELLGVWSNMNFEELPKTLQNVLCWDPDRWGILYLTENLQAFQDWLTQLHQGPAAGANVAEFLRESIESCPNIDLALGSPPWLRRLKDMLNAIHKGALVMDFQTEADNWAPWLLNFQKIDPRNQQCLEGDESASRETLSHFVNHLKTWSDIDAGLDAVKNQAPAYYPECREIAASFETVLSLTAYTLKESIENNTVTHPALDEAWTILAGLNEWRDNLEANDIDTAITTLNEHRRRDWKIIDAALQKTIHWRDEILLRLKEIQSLSEPKGDLSSFSQGEAIQSVSLGVINLRKVWQGLCQSGLHDQTLKNLAAAAEAIHLQYITWRRSIEHSNDRLTRLFYHHDLGLVREISRKLLRLSQHSRQTLINFLLLKDTDNTSAIFQIQSMEKIMDHLCVIEALLTPEPELRVFPKWQKEFIQIRDAESTNVQQQMVLALPDDHPLYSWMVQSVFTSKSK